MAITVLHAWIASILLFVAVESPAAAELGDRDFDAWVADAERQAQQCDDPSHTSTIQVNLASALSQQPGHAPQARRLAQAVADTLAQNPPDQETADELRIRLAYVFARLGDTDAAKQAAKAIVNPNEQMWALTEIAWGATERLDVPATDQALAEIRTAANALDPLERDYALAELPQLLLFTKDHDAAARIAREIEDPEARAWAFLFLAELAADLGQIEAAEKDLQQAQSLLITQPESLKWNACSIIVGLSKIDRPDAARRMLVFLEDARDRLIAFTSLASLHHRRGEAELANDYFQKARTALEEVKQDPESTAVDKSYAFADYAVALQQTQRYEQLATELEPIESPLDRGIVAACIATELAWQQFLQARRAN